eukprot:SAG31_NODE_12439_length_942_cov_1.412811_2_plen_83_part_01
MPITLAGMQTVTALAEDRCMDRCRAAAAALDVEPTAVAKASTDNAMRFFGLIKHCSAVGEWISNFHCCRFFNIHYATRGRIRI